MNDKAKSTLIDDLELSSNSAAWVRSLGVRTVGELLALPSLAPPDELVEAELGAHFEELGVEYEGQIVERARS